RTLPENSEIKLVVNKQIAIISSGLANFKLMCLPSQQFPNITEVASKFEFEISQKDFRFLIENVYFSIAEKEIRYFLNGLFFEKRGNQLRAVGADGHRLSMCTLDYNDLPETDTQMIVPRKATIELLRLLENKEEKVSIALNENHFR